MIDEREFARHIRASVTAERVSALLDDSPLYSACTPSVKALIGSAVMGSLLGVALQLEARAFVLEKKRDTADSRAALLDRAEQACRILRDCRFYVGPCLECLQTAGHLLAFDRKPSVSSNHPSRHACHN